ncbi:hypothetical protein [Puniceicoccus vermicola]|uniref:Uncharacterized protein n=1 Tax=Puniceicoccus vermicola TaxID=388746 RepID=A0A7X1AZ69_9BACT|nr:hypothetical protein [Puniceicoccus vermicola]MBC2602639.1 hypothetical protein [Puniceicoccus vermicola]
MNQEIGRKNVNSGCIVSHLADVDIVGSAGKGIPVAQASCLWTDPTATGILPVDR